MKPKINRPEKKANFLSTLRKEEELCIKHCLSPLELSALRHNFQPFTYKIIGSSLYISRHTCKQLLVNVKNNLSFLTNQLQKERVCKDVPAKHREAFEDPREILSLAPYLRNRLCKLDCYSMLRIMLLGREYFVNRKEFGPKSIKLIDGLFAKYQCSHLFK